MGKVNKRKMIKIIKRKGDWVDHFQTFTLQSENSTGATAAETESLTNTSLLQMGWTLQKKHASAGLLKRFGSI